MKSPADIRDIMRAVEELDSIRTWLSVHTHYLDDEVSKAVTDLVTSEYDRKYRNLKELLGDK